MEKTANNTRFSQKNLKLTNAEAGTERVCRRSSLWDMDVIEEQLDSLESVLRSLSVGSKAANKTKNYFYFSEDSIFKVIIFWEGH